jgi:uncharacterized protein
MWLVAAALALPLSAAVPLPTAPQRYVTDAANVIDEGRESALNERLAQFARETSNQVLVYVDRTLPPGAASIEEMGTAAIRTWGVGDAQKDNGVILFLFIEDRQSRIEVGYGLEEKLTGERSKGILTGLRPDLRAGDYATAVETGVTEIIAAITSQAPTITEPAPAVNEPVRVRRFMPPATGEDEGSPVFGILFVLGCVVFLVLAMRAITKHEESQSAFVKSSDPTNRSSSSSSSSFSFDSSPSSWSSSDSSSSSGSHFSGGGGSGGGGGASDNW